MNNDSDPKMKTFYFVAHPPSRSGRCQIGRYTVTDFLFAAADVDGGSIRDITLPTRRL